MKTELFAYELPPDRIAQRPAGERDQARLLVLPQNGMWHTRVADFAELVPEGALVVLNDTRVRKARLVGRREPGGGRVELLLLERLELGQGSERWSALGRANRPLRAGACLELGGLRARVLGVALAGGTLDVELTPHGGESVEAVVEREGHVPLPPYVNRPDDALDAERYQTVYARHSGSAAAPTAGLHLSHAVLERLEQRGVSLAALTLHVGLGTFRPVSSDDLDQHEMHGERFEVGERLVRAVAAARERNKPVVAIGTTVVRALESARDPARHGHLRAMAGETKLFIRPGYTFGVVDALLTNFHVPRSTLLALVAAFAGRERVLAAYAEALAAGYRFLSYGDAMWIPERAAS